MAEFPSERPARAALRSRAAPAAAGVCVGVLGFGVLSASAWAVADRASALAWILALCAAFGAGPRARRGGVLAALLLTAQSALHLCSNAAQSAVQGSAANPIATCASIPTATPGVIMAGMCTAGPHPAPQPWVISVLILLAHAGLALLSAQWLRYDSAALVHFGRSLAARLAALWTLPLLAPPRSIPTIKRRRPAADAPRIGATRVCLPVGRRGPPHLRAAL